MFCMCSFQLILRRKNFLPHQLKWSHILNNWSTRGRFEFVLMVLCNFFSFAMMEVPLGVSKLVKCRAEDAAFAVYCFFKVKL